MKDLIVGQVPEIKYSLIGSGRLARHLNFYFKNSGLKLSHWARNHDTRQKLPQILSTSDIILLAISDDAIENFITENEAFLKDKTCVHFSGSVVSENAIGIHPLNTFSEELYSMDIYKSTPMVADCAPEIIERIFPSLSNPVYFIEKEKKTIYHALVSMMGKFTNLLWKESIFELEKQTGLPKEMLYAYQNQIFEALKSRDKGISFNRDPQNPKIINIHQHQ